MHEQNHQQSLAEERKKRALDYHSQGRPGKIEVVATKPCVTVNDLSLAYTPGVAEPCLEIAKDKDQVFKYTAKGNLVAVVTNGTAVLGLGNIGPEAGKPVMEGKGILFKRFADIDVFDIEINEMSVEGVVNVVKALEPTFGGINLEDIKAPECFEIEKQLIEKMDIPVFHDDQHGTAIIAAAAFLNALEVTKRKIENVKVVFSGAGAAALASARLFLYLGVKKENVLMTDSKGVVYIGRKEGMNQYKDEFAVETTKRTLADAMIDADAFVGCSARGVLTKEMVKTMAKNPIIFAMANPEPEIYPHEVKEVRDDAIMATGRSDFPNQVNNVLGFPFIFRGALDVRARKINIEMKLAAVRALAQLAKEEVPEEVKAAYGNQHFSFGREYLIPKPFDRRVLTRVAPAVAKAAVESGVARIKMIDFAQYTRELEQRLNSSEALIKLFRDRLHAAVTKRKRKVKMVFSEGGNTRILEAMNLLHEEELIEPILLGKKEYILNRMQELGFGHLQNLEIVDPETSEHFEDLQSKFYKERQRKGVSWLYAKELMRHEIYFGPMMLKNKMAEAFVGGPTLTYPENFKPIMQIIGTHETAKASGVYILVYKNRVLFFTDCTAQVDPSEQDLVAIADAARTLYKKLMKKEPRVAFLSYSSFGESQHEKAQRIQKAVQITKAKYPDMIVDGEVQADLAINKSLMQRFFDFTTLDEAADILVFPDLNASNIAYKLLLQLSNASAIGPILVPMKQAANVLQRTASVNEVVQMSILTALMAVEE